MFRNRSRRFWAIFIVIVALIVFYLPALIGFRYTALSQNTSYLLNPLKGWSFVITALTVPGDAKLKTSGQALRRAEAQLADSNVDPQEVQLLFLPEGKPYTFTHSVPGREITTTVTPPYAFVWQITGRVDGSEDTLIALLDYDSGEVLYDVHTDLGGVPGLPDASPSASPAPDSSAVPSSSSTGAPGGTGGP